MRAFKGQNREFPVAFERSAGRLLAGQCCLQRAGVEPGDDVTGGHGLPFLDQHLGDRAATLEGKIGAPGRLDLTDEAAGNVVAVHPLKLHDRDPGQGGGLHRRGGRGALFQERRAEDEEGHGDGRVDGEHGQIAQAAQPRADGRVLSGHDIVLIIAA